MSDNFGSRDSHEQALETVKRTVGDQALGAHTGGYLSQDEYATKIYYWAGEEHEGEEIDGVIGTLANCSWAGTTPRTLPRAGTVMAFCELYPDREAGWQAAYPELFRSVARSMQSPKSDERWNDFLIAQWFVLRRAHKEEGLDIIDRLLDRVLESGAVGYDARRACEVCARQCKPFLIALQRGQKSRMNMRIIQ
jgi:hypothetical protein